jgi:hypothetical protein
MPLYFSCSSHPVNIGPQGDWILIDRAPSNPYQEKKPFSEEVLQKAEKFLRNNVGEDNFSLLSQNKFVEVKASNNMVYGFNRNGLIYKHKSSKLFKTQKTHGRLLSNTLPMDDLLVTFYIWATADPITLEKKWGCGNISIEDGTTE